MAVLPFIVFSTQYNYLRIFEIKVDDSSSALRFFSSPELAQGELLGYRDVRRPSYVWTSLTYETSETSVRQLFSLCTL